MLSIDASGDLALVGGVDGIAGVYSLSQHKVIQVLKGRAGPITDAVWAATRAIISTSAGRVKVFEGPEEIATFDAHTGEVTGLALHPSGVILASASSDKCCVLYDLESLTVMTQVYSLSVRPNTYYYSLPIHSPN